mgnify:CR=1 FL=1
MGVDSLEGLSKDVPGKDCKRLLQSVGVGGIKVNLQEGFFEGDKEFADDEDKLEQFIYEGVKG